MESLSIWHWLVLLFTLTPVGIAWIVVRVTAGSSPLGRRGFALRIIGLAVVQAILLTLFPATLRPYIGLFCILAAAILIPYWSLGRLADLHEPSKKQAILSMVPVMGFFVIFNLFFETEKYYSILARSIADQQQNTVDVRRALYQRARQMLGDKIKDELLLHRELSALENSIRKIEAAVA